MTRKVYDICAVTGKYTDSQGNQKSRYANVGAVMETDEGHRFLMINRWFNPAGVPDFSGKGGESVLLSLFEPKQNQNQQSQPQPQPQPQQNAYPNAAASYHPQPSQYQGAPRAPQQSFDDLPF